MHKQLISAGAGLFGFGALVGWALTADHFEQKMREREALAFERNQALRYHIVELEKAFDDLATDFASYKEDATEDVSAVTDEAVVPAGETVEETRSNLQSLIDEYTANPDDSSDEFVKEAVVMDRETPPFVISKEKFAWDEEEGDDYAKITLTYYPRHRLLLDDDEETVDDVATTVGWRNLSQFGGESGDPNVVFVRNRRMMTDFEVVRDEENEVPLHIKYGMGREEFNVSKAAGVLKLRPEDRA